MTPDPSQLAALELMNSGKNVFLTGHQPSGFFSGTGRGRNQSEHDLPLGGNRDRAEGRAEQ